MLAFDGNSDLIDPDSMALRTHAAKVCNAASAVVEGHISTSQREGYKRHTKGKHNE